MLPGEIDSNFHEVFRPFCHNPREDCSIASNDVYFTRSTKRNRSPWKINSAESSAPFSIASLNLEKLNCIGRNGLPKIPFQRTPVQLVRYCCGCYRRKSANRLWTLPNFFPATKILSDAWNAFGIGLQRAITRIIRVCCASRNFEELSLDPPRPISLPLKPLSASLGSHIPPTRNLNFKWKLISRPKTFCSFARPNSFWTLCFFFSFWASSQFNLARSCDSTWKVLILLLPECGVVQTSSTSDA